MVKIYEFLKSRTTFMSAIGGLFILFYLCSYSYQLVQINYFFIKGRLTLEVFERVITDSNEKLMNIVMIIVLFFYKGSSTNSNNNKLE